MSVINSHRLMFSNNTETDITRVERMVGCGGEPESGERLESADARLVVACCDQETYAPAAANGVILPSLWPNGNRALPDSITFQQLTLLRSIGALTQSHEAEAVALARKLETALSVAKIGLARAREEAYAIHGKYTRSIEHELKLALAAEVARHQAAFAAAQSSAKHEIGDFVIQTNVLEAKAQERLEETRWLADTVYESAAKKAAKDYESNQSQVEQRNKDVTQVELAAVDLLKRGRYRSMPDSKALTAALDDKTTSAEVELAESSAAAAKVIALGEQLHARVNSSLLNPGFVVGTVLTSGALGAIIAVVVHNNTPQLGKMIGMYAGVGLGAACIMGLIARFIVRSRVPRMSAMLAQGVAQSRWVNARATSAITLQRDEIVRAAKEKRDIEKQTARDRERANLESIQQRRITEEPALRLHHAAIERELTTQHEQKLADINQKAAHRRNKAQRALDESVHEATVAHDAAIVAAQERNQAESEALAQRWKTGLQDTKVKLTEILEHCGQQQPSWQGWGAFSAETYVAPTAVPDHITFGSYVVPLGALPGGVPAGLADVTHQSFPQDNITLPLAIDLKDKGSLLIQHDEHSRDIAITILNNLMMRIMTAFPPSKARFTIIDPVGLGQSFAAFAHLADIDEKLVHDKIWTDPKHIEQRLTDLTDHMETVIQKYLRNEFATIQEYNEQAGEVAEPYRFLVIADYPAQLSEQAAKRLASIITSGPRCGVFTLIAHDTRARPQAWLPTGELQRAGVWLRYDAQQRRFVLQHPEFSQWMLDVETPPAEDITTQLLKTIGGLSKELGKVRVPFEITAPRTPAQVWSLSSASEIEVPLGRSGATKLQYMTLGRGTAQHALIAGRTGSGKSTLLHVIIMNLALWYSPNEIELYLVDFKKGVEFKAYAAHQLPHARVVAIESEREFGLSVLRRLDAELTRRGQLFRDVNVQDVAAYRAKTGGVMPRVMLLVDEFQEFFVEDDKVAQEASLLLDRLVRQGRAFGMHVVLGSQTLGGAYSLARSTLGQMAVRIALQCSEADSYIIMSEDNPAPRLLSRPGEAIYNDASGLIEGNSPFQIVWLPEQTRDNKLDMVRERYVHEGPRGLDKPNVIVFEGNLPAVIDQNQHLLTLERGERGVQPVAPVQAWLGDAVSIKDPTHMVFRRQSASNLLIVGQQEESAAVMMRAIGRSVLAHRAHRPLLAVIDSTPADSTDFGKLEVIANAQPNITQLQELNIAPFAGPRTGPATVVQLAAEVKRREGLATSDAPQIFVLIMGLHRYRDLRKQDDFSFGSDDAQVKPDKALATLLRDGPAMGVHVIAWCDTAASVDRTLERQTTREFEAKVLFQMSANDSTNLIDLPTASALGRNRALLYREELGTVEKFRPYAPF